MPCVNIKSKLQNQISPRLHTSRTCHCPREDKLTSMTSIFARKTAKTQAELQNNYSGNTEFKPTTHNGSQWSPSQKNTKQGSPYFVSLVSKNLAYAHVSKNISVFPRACNIRYELSLLITYM